MKHKYLGGLLAGSISLSGGMVSAQTAISASEKEQSVGLEEIVVTARRREERMQEVPIAMTALQAADIEKSSYKNLTDVQYLAPSVNVNTSLAYPTYQIRGVGTQTYDTGAEASVGIVIDGVVEGNTRSLGINSLTDIERIEVLRGPQGTLFGKNSSAGVIHIITKQPVIGAWELDGRLSYGSDNETVANLDANIPISSTLAARVGGFYQDRDGFINNYDGRTLGANTDKGGRAKLLWQPNDDLSVTVAGYASRNDGGVGYMTLRSFGVATGPDSFRDLVSAVGVVPSAKNLDGAIYAGSTNYWWSKNFGGSIQADYNLSGYTFTSISGYRGWDLGAQYPFAQAPAPYFDVNRAKDYHSDQYTQEFRLQSPDGPFIYTAGLYFYDYKFHATQLQGGTFGLPLPPGERLSPSAGLSHYSNENISYAAFVDGTYHFSERLRVFAGARYTRDEVESGLYSTPEPGFTPFAPQVPFSGKVETDDFSWRFGGQIDVADDVMLYASASRGYKGPVAASLAGTLYQVRPETVLSYELGMKSLLLDQRVLVNLAVFHSKFKDFQASVYDQSVNPPANRLTNADSLTAKGIEADAQFRITSNLTLSANGSYNDTEYGDIYTSCYPLQPVSSSPANGACAPIPGSPGSTWSSMRGLPLATTPKVTYSVAADYGIPIGAALKADANIRYSWRDETRSNPIDPNTELESFGLLNANLGIGAQDGAWRAGVYARNLLDTHFVNGLMATFLDAGGYTQFPTAESERTFGATIDFRFR